MCSTTGHNVYVPQPNRHLQAIPPAASPEEAAAIVAAIERFMRDTAPAADLMSAAAEHEAWRETALLEGVTRELDESGPGSAHPWMRNA